MLLQNFGIHLRGYKVTRSGRPQSELVYQQYPTVYFRNPLIHSGIETQKRDWTRRDHQQFGCMSVEQII
jgi:hypothetical protein